MNRLTSLAYPRYKKDNNINSKLRMKAPFVKFRLGELYGKLGGRELMGYIDGISYAYPDNGTWETKKGQRVPKIIDCSIDFKVVHEGTPHMNTDFYGWDGKDGSDNEEFDVIPPSTYKYWEVLKYAVGAGKESLQKHLDNLKDEARYQWDKFGTDPQRASDEIEDAYN